MLHMAADRTQRLSVNLTPEVMQRLERFAQLKRWTLSNAAAVLIEQGLVEDDRA